MANIVKIVHPSIDDNENSTLTADVAVSATTFTVLNQDVFAVNDFILVESLGDEKAEIVQVKQISGKTITVEVAFKNAHDDGAVVTKLEYNQAKIYRATTFNGTYSLLGTAIALNVDEQYTYYNDTTGLSSSWYKAIFRNSYSGQETSLSLALPVRAEVNLIAIPGDPNSNSFITLAQAEEEIDQILDNEDWLNADMKDRARALIEATDRINNFPFKDNPVHYNQKLKLPNYGEATFSGNVTSGTTTSIVCSSLADQDAYYPDYWKYGGVRITEGTAKYSNSLVLAFDRETGTLTLENALSATPDTTSQFILTFRIPDEIRRAVAKLALWLIQQGTGEQDPNVQSKSIGNFSVSYFDRAEKGSMPKDIMELIRPYIKRVSA